MKKLLILLVFLLCVASVSAAVDLIETNITQMFEQGDSNKTINFNVRNTGASAITVNFTHNVDLTDNDGSSITLTLPGIQTVNPGQTLLLQINVSVPGSQDFDKYTGSVTATASDGTTDSFTLILDVQPVICDSGIAGSSLKVTIKDPNDGDDIRPGDTITLNVDVKNQGTDDIDVQTEAFLFNDEDSAESTSSDTKNVDNGKTEDFKMSLKVPTDSNELGRDKSFRLYIKAFDDNNEAAECTQEFVELNLDLKAKDVVIDQAASSVIPNIAVCEELASAQVTVMNIGDKEINKAFVTLRNDELKINQKTDTFKIRDFNSGEDNSVTRRLEFKIPADAKEKTYQLEAKVNFDGGSSTDLLPLTVQGCKKSVFETAFGEVGVEVSGEELSLKQGSATTIPVKVINTNNEKKTFKIYFSNIAEFAESSAVNTLTLLPGQGLTTFLDIKIKENAEPGTYTGLAEVSLNGVVINSRAITFDVKGREKETPIGFVVAGIVIALGVIVVTLIGLLKPKTR